jgi:Uma2 family endonuclease
MRTHAPGRPITAKEFQKFDSEWRYDLINGELRPMPPMPGEKHGAVTYDLGFELGLFVRQHDLGQCYAAETRFIITHNPDTTLGPDWAFIAKERLPKKRGEKFLDMAPDAVLEVRSPSDRPRQVQEKVEQWLTAGVRIVWELNLKTKILTVHRPSQESHTIGVDGEIDGEDVLPGFRFPLRRLFEEDE